MRGRKWTDEEYATLLALRGKGTRLSTCAVMLGRPYASVQLKMQNGHVFSNEYIEDHPEVLTQNKGKNPKDNNATFVAAHDAYILTLLSLGYRQDPKDFKMFYYSDATNRFPKKESIAAMYGIKILPDTEEKSLFNEARIKVKKSAKDEDGKVRSDSIDLSELIATMDKPKKAKPAGRRYPAPVPGVRFISNKIVSSLSAYAVDETILYEEA